MVQIDMQIPTNCLDCPACNEYLMCAIPVNGRKWGENDVREYGNGRPEWCPLKDIHNEQEAVKPIRDDDGYYRCESCNAYVAFPNGDCKKSFCEKCGKAVKWNEE